MHMPQKLHSICVCCGGRHGTTAREAYWPAPHPAEISICAELMAAHETLSQNANHTEHAAQSEIEEDLENC